MQLRYDYVHRKRLRGHADRMRKEVALIAHNYNTTWGGTVKIFMRRWKGKFDVGTGIVLY
jgi:hypothetical protein